MNHDGIIFKGIGGFYYVKTAEGIFECKAKGKFRKEKITPLAGDRVTISVNSNAENTIDLIHERKNCLNRPPVANIDLLAVVVSTCEPMPNRFVIDKMTVLAEKNGIEPVIIITKSDLVSEESLVEIYSKTPYRIFVISKDDSSCLEELRSYLKGKLTAFTGNSGVGKSTLINSLGPHLVLETADISNKLGRGRHTTRQAEIFEIDDCRIIDTAGFSSLDFIGSNVILKDELQFLFPEFDEYLGQCRFVDCAHTGDKSCKICEMSEKGVISKSRYESYISMYNEAKNIKEWEL